MKRDWRAVVTFMIVVFFLVATLGGCACFRETAVRDTPIPEPEPVAEVTAPAPAPAPAPKPVDEAEKARQLREKILAEARAFEKRHIHFDFDRYNLRPEARAVLDALGAWLLTNKDHFVLIEGHCDERGTAEYNLALGERRAKAAKDYLVNLGVDAKRLDTISYGEERPFDPRSNEAAWAKNRRCEFNLIAR